MPQYKISNSLRLTIGNKEENDHFIKSIRGLRYVYPSKMNFAALIFHSLAIISVFRNIFIIRSTALLLLCFLFLVFEVFLWF